MKDTATVIIDKIAMIPNFIVIITGLILIIVLFMIWKKTKGMFGV